MNRDLVVSLVAFVTSGVGIWLAGWFQPSRRSVEAERDSGRRLEQRHWWRLWTPALVPSIAIATLFGWRQQEPPVTDEPLTHVVILFVVPAALLWLRCGWRAIRASLPLTLVPPIATLGLIRPRVIASPALDGILDPAEKGAALAHERAHARHHDPLRILVAQMMSDLQWPNPFARRRFEAWLSALELARDEEARVEGAAGEDLAAAIVAVARISAPLTSPAARLTGAGASLTARVRRLLAPLLSVPPRRARLAPFCVCVAIVLGVLAGVTHGDAFLRALPFVAG